LFLAKTSTTSEWKAIAAAVKTLVEEATFEANGEGMKFRAMDPSHVALVDLVLPSSSFSSYECDKPLKFSVRVEDLVKVVARAETKDTVTVSQGVKDEEDAEDEDAITVVFQNGYKRKFVIHLIESTASSAPLPKLEFDTKATVTKAIMDKILGDINVVSDQVTIQATKDKMVFSGKSDVGNAKVALGGKDADVLKLESNAESRATFSIEYITSILKALGGVADTLELEYSTKKPIRMNFALNAQGARLQFFLAPRVQD
jgi:proliferating cell nuclear antigen